MASRRFPSAGADAAQRITKCSWADDARAAARIQGAARMTSAPRRRASHGRPGPNNRRLDLTVSRARLQFRWADAISEAEWALYRRAIEAMRDAGLKCMLGGGFALAAFTGRWRDTKDIDLYIRPEDRDTAIKALGQAGFTDYFERLPYDRRWIYRSTRSDVIVDIIWSMANRRAQVDSIWFERAGTLSIRSQALRVIPPEEFMWCKLYILQRDHCDWTDIFNLLFAIGPRLDWNHLIERLEDDRPLLKAVLTVYCWLCPKEAARLPGSLWKRLGMRAPAAPRRRIARDRVRLLDSRCWFASLCARGQKLEI